MADPLDEIIAKALENLKQPNAGVPPAAAEDKRVSTRTIDGVSYQLYERPDKSLYVRNLSSGEITEGGFPGPAPKETAAPRPASSGGGGGGGSAPPAVKPAAPKGEVTREELEGRGAVFGAGVAYADGNVYRQEVDGSFSYSRAQTKTETTSVVPRLAATQQRQGQAQGQGQPMTMGDLDRFFSPETGTVGMGATGPNDRYIPSYVSDEQALQYGQTGQASIPRTGQLDAAGKELPPLLVRNGVTIDPAMLGNRGYAAATLGFDPGQYDPRIVQQRFAELGLGTPAASLFEQPGVLESSARGDKETDAVRRARGEESETQKLLAAGGFPMANGGTVVSGVDWRIDPNNPPREGGAPLWNGTETPPPLPSANTMNPTTGELMDNKAAGIYNSPGGGSQWLGRHETMWGTFDVYRTPTGARYFDANGNMMPPNFNPYMVTPDYDQIPRGQTGILRKLGIQNYPREYLQSPFNDPYRSVQGFARGGTLMVDEPIVGLGMNSGQERFTMGEPNALRGGAPTREMLNVTPLEPSMPMQPQPMMQQMTPFAQLMESMFGQGRRPGSRPPRLRKGAY